MSRAEPCPIKDCTEFKAHGKPFCRGHWRALPVACRAQIVRALARVFGAARFGDDPAFRRATDHYHECCSKAAEIITNLEGIDASV